jgi:hypothetical protein
MNFYWARSNKFLLVLLVIAVAIVGVLTTLVMYQQYDQSMVDGQVHLRTAPTVSAVGVSAGADMMAVPNAATHPEPATRPDPANVPVGPASQPAPASPAPQVATTPITPALGASAPDRITSPQLGPSPQTPLKPKTLPHRRVNSVPAPTPAAVAHPVIPAPQIDPVTPTRSAKPGAPDGW